MSHADSQWHKYRYKMLIISLSLVFKKFFFFYKRCLLTLLKIASFSQYRGNVLRLGKFDTKNIMVSYNKHKIMVKKMQLYMYGVKYYK